MQAVQQVNTMTARAAVWLAFICETHVFWCVFVAPVHMEWISKNHPVPDVQRARDRVFVLFGIRSTNRRQTRWNGALCFSSTVPCWA